MTTRPRRALLGLAITALLGSLLQASPAQATPYDHAPPTILAAHLSVDTVDVTSASAQVTVRLHLADDTGVYLAQSTLAEGHNGVAYYDNPRAVRTSGTDRNGWWESTITIPRGAPDVTLHLEVSVTDGHRRSTYADEAGEVRVLDADPDESAPDVTVRSLSPDQIDVRHDSQQVAVTIHATDVSGVSSLGICLGSPGLPDEYVAHPLYSTVACDDHPKRQSGTARDGLWRSVLTVPRRSVSGRYNLRVEGLDQAGNDITWYGPDEWAEAEAGHWCCGERAPLPDEAGRVDVIGVAADVTPPTADRITASRTRLHTLRDGDRTQVRVHARDAEGVKRIEAFLLPDSDLSSAPAFPRTMLRRASGTPRSGWWQGDVVAPRGTPPGTYHVMVAVIDRSFAPMYTDPATPGADGVTYEPLAGVPTIKVVRQHS